MRSLILIAPLLMVACAKDPPPPQTPASEPAQGRVRSEVEAELKKVDEDLKTLDTKIEATLAEGKKEASEAMKKTSKELHDLRDRLRKELDAIDDQTRRVQKDIEADLSDLKARLKKALQ